MRVLLVIPARYGSSRFPGKPLVALRGADGEARSLIERSWQAGRAVRGMTRVVVATDDDRIRAAAEAFGADVAMTSPDCANGTERCADALERLGESYDVIVNLQGDAPLTPPWFVEELVAALARDRLAQVATPVLRCDEAHLAALLEDRRHGRVGGTTAVFDAGGRALYFSKEVIPFGAAAEAPVFHHVGVYAYRPDALAGYARRPAGPLETAEGLEQLRFLENGLPVLCVEVEARGRSFWEVNNPEDVARVEGILAGQGMR